MVEAPGAEGIMVDNLNEKSRLSLPLTMVLSLVVSALSGTIAATTAAYGFRDTLLDKVHAEVVASATQERAERANDLRYYVDKEAFGEWKQRDRVRQDQQYYGILNAIERLSARMGRK